MIKADTFFIIANIWWATSTLVKDGTALVAIVLGVACFITGLFALKDGRREPQHSFPTKEK